MQMTKNSTMIQALRFRPLIWLLLGQSISTVGDGAFTVALAWEVILLTGSATAMSLVVIARTIPLLLFLLIGGVAADRMPRRLIMLCSDAGRAVVVFFIAVLGWFHLLQLWHLIALSLIFGFVQGFFLPAYQAIVPELVKKESLVSANSLKSLSRRVAQLIGPTVGAACIALASPFGAFVFDGLTFIFSAICLLLLKNPSVTPAIQEASQTQGRERETLSMRIGKNVHSTRADIHEGIQHVLGSTWLWLTIVFAAFGNIGFSGALSISLPKLVNEMTNSGVWVFGLFATINYMGAIIAPFFVGLLSRVRHRGVIAYLAVALCGGAFMIIGIPLPEGPKSVIICISAGVIGFSLTSFGILWDILLQEHIPQDRLGRVNSLDLLGSYGLTPIGYLVIGILSDRIGPSLVFLFSGLLNIVLAAVALSIKDIRGLR